LLTGKPQTKLFGAIGIREGHSVNIPRESNVYPSINWLSNTSILKKQKKYYFHLRAIFAGKLKAANS